MTDTRRPITQENYLELFSHLSHILAQTTDLRSLLDSSVRIIQSVLNVESCSIMLLAPESGELTMAASSNIPESEWPSIRVPLGQGIAGRVAETGKSILMARPEADRDLPSSQRAYQTETFICVPLKPKQGTLGVINMTDHSEGRDLTTIDLDMLQAIAHLVASAVENQRLWVRTHQAREHLSSVLDGLPVGMFTITLSGRLTLCNAAARRFLELPPQIELNRPWQELFADPVSRHVEKALEAVAGGQDSFIAELEMPLAECGGVRSVRVSALRAEDITGLEEGHVLFIIEDLRQMQELAELRKSDQMKSNFLSIISHELRTPLASIKGAIHLLNQMSTPELRSKTERVFDILHRNSDRLTRLVNNILDVMDLEAETLSLYRKRTDLHQIVARVAEKFSRGDLEKNLEWRLRLNAERHQFYVDESRLGQVFYHICENAVKFAPEGGAIEIETFNDHANWVLRVANTGREIDEKQREKIFTKFYQIDASLTRDCGGSGLGLFLCREIVRKHGGEIWVDPGYREGARFVLSIPEVNALS